MLQHTSFRHAAALAVLAGTVLALAAAPAQAQTAPSSSADALSADFTSGGLISTLAPVALAKGEIADTLPPNGYNVTVTKAKFDATVAIATALSPTLAREIGTLTVNAAKIVSHASSAGFGVDNVGTEGNGTIGTASLSLEIFPPPPVVPLPLLLVTAATVTDQSSDTVVFPHAVTIAGSAGFGGLTIVGRLLDGQSIHVTGNEPANTVLYSSPTVKIVANEQIIPTLVSCSGTICVVTPDGITTNALAVHLTNVSFLGYPVSGDILLGSSSAQVPLN